ncbi:hypothetical protein MCOR02_008091 [Pyricularia oryzae]|uniref:3-phytase n=5 Tax=Pyricularia TaxID=48558 RepID=A0ABQ8NX27_PYRGI|nr:uncharacterized protein MGG_06306 [Pyricularia oryzae 70-15]ELQ37998.1 hypothetical protein OOU_Y34scaffold00559g26 [Pyricularia oryzae Y34]KAH9430761.1 hypothetical protein MCOR02_008091 [Pyricularia oryzae]KAI6302840.1 hypothetical protein MCOR33_001922 [Pyricularia grisea]EHA50959.1 hypothetical protein MGG_06306 [Pyricularia oryzae 70-15]KAI6279642.1 hypothetical protein MCOR26_004115 [Pyricularia oryzae]
MTTLQPRAPYTDEELRTLYPSGLDLQLVQVLMRHGERTPVSSRFQNAGLKPFWPYCRVAKELRSVILEPGNSGTLSTLEWSRRIETFGHDDEPRVAAGPRGEVDAVCDMGMLTDEGRATTYALGQRLRRLYVEQLGFLPATAAGGVDDMYLRSTPIPRALESLQQAFSALYPPATRLPAADGSAFRPPTIVTRTPGDETLYPNDAGCRRLAALSRAFAQRTADRWNDSADMEYLNRLWAKWMPADSPRVAVDSRPRLSGIMDTVNSTLGHGPETRLPREFYDKKAIAITEKIGVEEWFSGYKESREYRALGIGSLMGDIVGRMISSVEGPAAEGTERKNESRNYASVKFGLSGCHDTTLAGILASLGAFETDKWPPYTSHVAIEMFRDPTRATATAVLPTNQGWWSALSSKVRKESGGIGRRTMDELSPSETERLDGYYVRVRYNDEPVTIPGCKIPGNHLYGNENFCTLRAFKSIVDKYTPRNWKEDCRRSTTDPVIPAKPEPAGF